MTTTTEQEQQRLDDAEYEAALARLRDYHDLLDVADRQVDSLSLARAADLAKVYEDRRWMDDPELTPARADALGRLRPDSRNRFAKWVQDVSPVRLRSRHTTELLAAHDLNAQVSTVSAVAPTGERVLRPLKSLVRTYPNAVPEVWSRAIEIAEGDPTAEQVTRAKRDFLAQYSPKERRREVRITRAQREAKEVRLHFSRLMDQQMFHTAAKLLIDLRSDLIQRRPPKSPESE